MGGLSDRRVTVLKGVGPKSSERLQRLGIRSVQDLLFHLPLRYQDRTRVVPMGALRPGDQAVVEGTVEQAGVRLGRRRSLLVRLADGTGSVTLRFFHFSRAQQDRLARGARLRCFGEVRNGPAGAELVHPEYQPVDEGEPAGVEEALTPVYPTTEGMHQLTWRELTAQALAMMRGGDVLQELLPRDLLADLNLPSLDEAVALLHRPPPDVSLAMLQDGRHPAQRRLAFEELLAHQVSLRRLREKRRSLRAPGLRGDGRYRDALVRALPFRLTGAQSRVAAQIAEDLGSDRPMLRLVQGDVGSGKTVVAALAALQTVEAGYQVAFMAPTELLAEQHRRNLSAWLEPLGVRTAFLTGRHKGTRRRATLDSLAAGELGVVVGTHALFQEDVQYRALGLVIVDEQHRFGVHQRLALREKAGADVPHQLVMTATPIPRTLAMTSYADLDLSVIDELPPGRKPVETVVLPDTRREEVVRRVEAACNSGRQAYWVCTLIEESEALQCQAAEDTAQSLADALQNLNVGLVHGRLKADAKAAVMEAFKQGEIDLLVATTVIEVGVDVPNASLMIIENAERLGLAQLHQLRGRVGRGADASHCVLLYQGPLGGLARERLGVMRETGDGFVIAQRDLEIRGPGEVLGTRQTGEVGFRVADLVRDQDLVPEVQRVADRLIRDGVDTLDHLVGRWISQGGDYANV